MLNDWATQVPPERVHFSTNLLNIFVEKFGFEITNIWLNLQLAMLIVSYAYYECFSSKIEMFLDSN